MKKGILILTFAFISMNFISCKSGKSPDTSAISTDSAIIAMGDGTFDKNCSSCHNFKQNGIGPQLGGLTADVPADWIKQFIRDPKKLVESGDARALQLQHKYKVLMPSFAQFSDDQLNGIVAFIHTHKKPVEKKSKSGLSALADPIPDSIALSSLVVDLNLVTQIPASSDSGKLPLTRITKLDFESNSGTNYVVDLRGKLYKLQNNKASVYLDLRRWMPKFIHESGLGSGFGSFAFHPEFAKNGFFYTTHTERPGSGNPDFNYEDSIKVSLQWVLTEWKTDHPESAVFSGKSRELLRINMVTVMHGVQEITFNPLSKPGDKDYGLLYIGVGDGGSVDEGYPFLIHRRDRILGTIIRINPRGNNSVNGKYGIPQDNPYAKSEGNHSLREIYAYGFRNPHRITWTKSGELIASNIGGANIESINMVKPGQDFGWPIREGNFMVEPDVDWAKVYPLPANDSSFHVTYPVAEYDHNGGAAAISGGYEYWGCEVPELKGKFLFGDIPSGRLFYINMADLKQGKQAPIYEWRISLNGKLTTLRELCKTDRVDLHFGRDAKGELYILTKPDGKIYSVHQHFISK
ncbi:PQQ-dependent sugar dehydrogenase [Flavihumibacter profundi]|uniref:PQQ-dependent sugar dehydrogenase n=1 Tax=Flavihumibacter profundi TaxID=2716883 RepID=UPI001CC34C67|nr:PQQ-dependent sugar dehydrogenase [Flavihumibacter profundi]MBZ5857675.1 PQQ-dependent sugar dehydrogenase [Flavihumibacter profundi]